MTGHGSPSRLADGVEARVLAACAAARAASSPARARAQSEPESVSRSSSLGSIADLQAEAEAARRRKKQLQAENAKNAERLGAPRRDPLADARTPPASPPASSPPRSPRRPTLEMEELAAAVARCAVNRPALVNGPALEPLLSRAPSRCPCHPVR